MKLMTKEIEKKIPELYSQEHVKDPKVIVKFFTPWSSWTWYMTEGRKQENGDWLFFGKVVNSMCPDGELGYTMLSQLQEMTGPFGLGIERDLHFDSKPLSQCN